MNHLPRLTDRQPSWWYALAALRSGPKSSRRLRSTIERERPGANPAAALRWLKRRGFVTGDGMQGYKITLSGVGALTVTRRRIWKA
jgi:hypothetical protein